MSSISERLVVRCPDREACRHLAAFLAKHQRGDGTVRVTLRLSNGLFTEPHSLAERRVTVTLYPLRSITDPHPTYSITWTSRCGGATNFTGALAVEKHPRDDRFGLVVSGRYEPSLTSAHHHAPTARRVSQAAARDLMRAIAEHAEQASAHAEAARAGHIR